MRCWGKTSDRAACRRTATTWCVLANVRYALCDRHAAANEGKPLLPIRSAASVRTSAR
jgi:hypothetical protein